jgi:Trk K+ transport system NAD-binding subunit
MDRMARGDTELEAGVRYILGVEPHAIDDVLNLFRG